MPSDSRSYCLEEAVAAVHLIREAQPRLNAFVEFDEASVMQAAREFGAVRAEGWLGGAQHCMLVGVKDIFAVAGTVMRAGSRAYQEMSPRDAWAVARLRQRGAVIVGRTRTHEIAFGSTGINHFDGGARNPLDLSRIPGGSSSGSAAAVAAGLCRVALGSDTGGSCRIPAAMCGILGFKPTYDLVNREGLLPLSRTLDHVGWFARTVADVGEVLNALVASGRLKSRRRGGRRIGILAEYLQDLDPQIAGAIDWYQRALQSSGYRVQQVTLAPIQRVMDVSTDIMFYEAFEVHQRKFRSNPELFGPDIRDRLEQGARISRASYVRALKERKRLVQESETLFARVSALLSPTVPIAAPTYAEVESPTVRSLLPRNTRLHSLIGVPTLAFPIGDTRPGVGVQVAGPWMADRWILRVGAEMQRIAAG